MRRFLPSLLVLVAGLLATLGAWRLAVAYERDRALGLYRAAFEQTATNHFVAVERAASEELAVVQGLAAFFASSVQVDPDEFVTFTAPALDRYSGLVALEWAPRVPGAELSAWLEQLRAEGHPDAVVRGVGMDDVTSSVPRAEYYPIRYVHPVLGNESVLGMDLASEQARRSTAMAAIRTGRLQTTSPLSLVQGGPPHSAVLAMAPLYRRGASLATVSEREASAVGLVLGVYRVDELMRAATRSVHASDAAAAPPEGVDLLVYTAAGDEHRTPLFVLARDPAARLQTAFGAALDDLHAVHSLGSFDDSLLVVARPALPPPSAIPLVMAWSALGSGIALTLALAVAVQILVDRNRAVERQVEERTTELRAITRSLEESERELRAIVDHSIDGILVADSLGRVLSVNPVVSRMFGLRSDDLVGRSVTMLLPEPHRSRVDAELRGLGSSVGQGVVGRISELNARRASGAIFPMELAVVELEDMTPTATLWILRDISERRAVEQMKDRFISTVSHELRTPLSSILGSLELVKDGLCGPLPNQAQRMVDLAFGNGERLLRLINDLLDLERLAGGGMELHLEPIDAGELVDQAIEAHLGLARRHDVHLGRKVRPGTHVVRADRHRLLQVFANLLGNAIRFSPAGGGVRVGADERNGEVIFSVQDEGEGIPSEFHPYVFAPFSQADASDRRKVGGSGLGLSIAKAIVEEHGGSIWFETRRGSGTTFFFSLPAVSPGRPGALSPSVES